MGDTKIPWTDKTWNPVTGCSKVSDGCRNCYAERLALRFGWSEKPWTASNARENVRLHPERLGQPLRWRKPCLVFVNSMSDLFHDQVPISFIGDVVRVMAAASQHRFQVLTKRPRRMLEVLLSEQFAGMSLPLPNVWLGVSVENQQTAEERIPLLLAAPAAVRFVSCEPLLEGIRLRDTWLTGLCDRPCAAYMNGDPRNCGCASGQPPNARLNQVIVGGESGRGFRPMDLDWARAIRDQCRAAGTAFWFKQAAAIKPGTGKRLDGEIWEQYPWE